MKGGVVVGYDGSECAKAALRVAAGVARTYGEPLIIAFGYGVSPVGGELADYQAALREAGELVAGEGIEVEAVRVERDPAPALADLAAEREARMIVVGTHGESPLRSALIGSTPHKLLQLSERPVLVVPAD